VLRGETTWNAANESEQTTVDGESDLVALALGCFDLPGS
jgi:hypothetical protein